MKKVWADAPKVIVKEIKTLKKQKTPLTLCRKGEKNITTSLMALKKQDDQYVMAFSKNDAVEVSKEACLIFYKPAPHITRAFQGAPLVNTDKFFTMACPKTIFELSLRKFPRVSTPPPSKISFSKQGKSLPVHCDLLDISLAGAMMIGEFPSSMKTGEQVGPIVVNLHLTFSSEIETVQIKKATIMNIIDTDDGYLKKVGLHFNEKDANQINLEPYIDIRIVEESVLQKE